MRYFSGLNMGEGIVGAQQVGLATSVIYSCMGIAFVNTQTGWGGLYHYPSNSVGDQRVAGTIIQMYNDVRPDNVVVTPASSNGVPMMGSSEQDIQDVAALLQQLGGAQLFRAPARSSAMLHWSALGVPVYNDPQPPGVVMQVGVPVAVRSSLRTSGRLLRAGVWHYGGDGETPGVL